MEHVSIAESVTGILYKQIVPEQVYLHRRNAIRPIKTKGDGDDDDKYEGLS